MYKIVYKEKLNDLVTRLDVEAPLIARKAQAGQFIIFRIDEFGERVPLTVADTDPEAGTVSVIFQAVGKATRLLAEKEAGGSILDFVGPLGVASELEGYERACVVGGGVGSAIAYPSAKALFNYGTDVDVIAGFRNKEIVILEEQFRAVSAHTYIMTDDGSYGEKGFVTDKLQKQLEAGRDYDLVVAIGPVGMMRAVTALTKGRGIKTLVSLNPIMVDGTGMCGGCRVTVGGETRFACVDGPEFDGHLVDFADLYQRNRAYVETEEALDHQCRIGLSQGKQGVN